MKWFHDGIELEDVFAKVRSAKQRVLFADYDGTLAPLMYDRSIAKPYPGLVDVLNQIAAAPNSQVVVISGRSLQNLRGVLKLGTSIEMWGTYGWELQTVDGKRTTWPISDGSRQAMYEVINWAENEEISSYIDVKTASVAVKWHGTDAKMREHLMKLSMQIMQPLVDKLGLELRDFDGGRELRVPGRSKCDAVEHVFKRLKKNNSAFVYLGDNISDEEVFEVIGKRGLRVLVRTLERPTKADMWLRPPRELLRFLEAWLAAVNV